MQKVRIMLTDCFAVELSKLMMRHCSGKATRGYDPSQDILWLRSEIVRWIEGNLLEKW